MISNARVNAALAFAALGGWSNLCPSLGSGADPFTPPEDPSAYKSNGRHFRNSFACQERLGRGRNKSKRARNKARRQAQKKQRQLTH